MTRCVHLCCPRTEHVAEHASLLERGPHILRGPGSGSCAVDSRHGGDGPPAVAPRGRRTRGACSEPRSSATLATLSSQLGGGGGGHRLFFFKLTLS